MEDFKREIPPAGMPGRCATVRETAQRPQQRRRRRRRVNPVLYILFVLIVSAILEASAGCWPRIFAPSTRTTTPPPFRSRLGRYHGQHRRQTQG
ncbi:MAG: hypothetical protein V8R40_08680 [Dysosmobacter sp.]